MVKPPPLGRLRLASVRDARAILELVNDSMARNFRVHNISDVINLVENSVLSICQTDENESIVGFLSAKDFPLIPSLHPKAWEEYIWTKYKTIELNSRNTLWLHLLCWDPRYARDAVDSMLKSVFMHDAYVNHIAMTKSLIDYPRTLLSVDTMRYLQTTTVLYNRLELARANEIPSDYRRLYPFCIKRVNACLPPESINNPDVLVPGQSRTESSFRRVQAMERGIPGDQLPALAIADRTEVSPRLRIRRAVEEDNDDIVPIIERQSSELKRLYGEFYVAELVSRHPESERVLLVCEDKELAVGVMCINTQINFEALEESFELSPFAGLRHPDTDSCHRTKTVPEDVTSVTSFSSHNAGNTSSEHLQTQENNNILVVAKDTKSSVVQAQSAVVEYSTEDLVDVDNSTELFSCSSQLDIVDMLGSDEEMDFDIINIDFDLLRTSQAISYSVMEGLRDSKVSKYQVSTEEISDTKIDSVKSMIPSISTIEYREPEPNRYSGKSNAFLLELFAMHADYDERYGFDILEAAFELFPDRDYCVMSLPSYKASLPLLEHFTSVTPYSTRTRFINEALYVAHVNSVRGHVAVRPGEPYDLRLLGDLLEHVPHADAMTDLFKSTLTSNVFSSYVLQSEKQPIGIAILGALQDGTMIRLQYNLKPEPRRPSSDATIIAGVMSPTMEPHGRWYLRELMRLSEYTALFWHCNLFAKGDMHPSLNLMSLSAHMMPVHPRHPVPNLSKNKTVDAMFQEEVTPFALWVLNRTMTSLPKLFVNTNIVVVGASRTGLAFIESLLMGPTAQYLTFTNVTLVSEHGLPTVGDCLKVAETCVPTEGRYSDRYLKRIPFYFYVDVISAVMVNIDRKKKCIQFTNGGIKYYDLLVLTCGHQFQHPEYLQESLEKVKEVENEEPCKRMLMDNPKYMPDRVPLPSDMPCNLMLINSLYEANFCLRKLQKMISLYKDKGRSLSKDNHIVVYGECIEAYSCMAALLELGIGADMITFVEPFPPPVSSELRINCFNNETVDERVQASLNKLGIRVFRRCLLESWWVEDNLITLIELMSPLHVIKLPCFAIFYYGVNAIDIHTFKAINESRLVYDGGLIVGPTFETNDPHIYGAGPCTRYSRRLYANRRAHRYYSSEEIGETLGKIFLRKLDPFMIANPDTPIEDVLPRYNSTSMSKASRLGTIPAAADTRRRWNPVVKLESPSILSATLPGPLYYMKLRKPGPEIPMEVQLSLPHQGHFLMTDHRNNYFSLHLNALHCVEHVTCLSKEHFSVDVMSQLYGKHETFFNKLLARFQMGLIEDFYEFFSQPWMGALYQETFDELLQDITEQEVGTVYDLVNPKFNLVEGSKSRYNTLASSPSIVLTSGYGPEEARNLGTFRSVVDRFVARTIKSQTECGQDAAIRAEAAAFWRAVGGKRIVDAHVARYLSRHIVTNPQYAAPKQ